MSQWDKIAERYAEVSGDVRQIFLHPAIVETLQRVCRHFRNHFSKSKLNSFSGSSSLAQEESSLTAKVFVKRIDCQQQVKQRGV